MARPSNTNNNRPLHQVRLSIESLCKMLCLNDTLFVIPETIRKAKFNKEEAVKPLLSLLYEMCVLVSSELLPTIHPETPELVAVVTETMKTYGYQDAGEEALNVSTGSQDLLLAFSWLLAKERLPERIILDAVRTLPVDVHCLKRSCEHKQDDLCTLASDTAISDGLRQVVWLLGKCKMRIRSLTLLVQEYTALIHKINNFTNGVRLSSFTEHLSILETFVLRHPQHLTQVQLILENTNSKLDSYLKWKENEAIFWTWMESVVDFKLQNMDGSRKPKAFTPTMHHNGDASTRVLHLQKLDSQLHDSIEKWTSCASDLDDKIKVMVCNANHATKPSQAFTEIQQESSTKISGYKSRNVIPSNVYTQRFIHTREQEKRQQQHSAQRTVNPERTLATMEEKINIKHEISRLELKVKERKELLQGLTCVYREELESILIGMKCICIPPLAKNK